MGSRPTDPDLHGVAPNSFVMPIMAIGRNRCLSDPVDGCVGFDDNAVRAALEYIHDFGPLHNVTSVNMSFGSIPAAPPECPDPYGGAVLRLRRRGIVVVSSGGNHATDSGYTGGLGSPGCLPGVTSVGASGDDDDDIWAGTKFSAAQDIFAPGSSIDSSVPWTGPPQFPAYLHKTGTSMAAPHVAGAVSLVATMHGPLDSDNIVGELKRSGAPILDSRIGLSFPRLDLRNVSPPLAMPHAPVAVVLFTTSATVAELRWSDDSAIEDRFELEARLNGIAQVNLSPAVGANNTRDASTAGLITGLSPGSAYEGFVRACRLAICSAWTGPVAFTTRTLAVPTSPLTFFRVQPGSLGATSFALEWLKNPLGNATHVRLNLFGPRMLFSEHRPLTNTPDLRVISNLEIDHIYTAFIRVCNANGCGPAQSLSIHTLGGDEMPPVITDVSRVSDREWDVTWTYTPATNLPAVQSIQLDSTIPTGGGMTWTTTSLAATVRTYRVTRPSGTPSIAFRVRACRAAGCTDYSDVRR